MPHNWLRQPPTNLIFRRHAQFLAACIAFSMIWAVVLAPLWSIGSGGAVVEAEAPSLHLATSGSELAS
jgi:hypothetical protein